MAREDPQLKLRLPPDLKAQVEAAAHAAGRSLNGEIVKRLTQSFQPVVNEETAVHDLIAQYDRLGELLDAAVRRLQSGAPPSGQSARPLKRRD